MIPSTSAIFRPDSDLGRMMRQWSRPELTDAQRAARDVDYWKGRAEALQLRRDEAEHDAWFWRNFAFVLVGFVGASSLLIVVLS